MCNFKRITVIVMDSVGVGALPDAYKYDDDGSDSLGNTAEAVGGIQVSNLEKLGLANLHFTKGVNFQKESLAYYTKMLEISIGKDTMTGHWEMMGLNVDKPFKTFTDTGFPPELIAELELQTGHKVIGNYSSSGTEILDELGERHMATGEMIVYTSADSVLQIAAHEETFGLKELLRCCEIARTITMKDDWKVGRIIARPFVGQKVGEFKRTSNRHDYALKPFEKTVLDKLKAASYDVISIGKIYDIFDSEGLTEAHKSKTNSHGMDESIKRLKEDFTGLMYVNLVDFDALWGHRRNALGYAKELESFDIKLGEFLSHMNNDDLLILTADHGTDPTHHGTDHTREMIPFIVYSPRFTGSGLLPLSKTFADIGATIADNFNIELPKYGVSVLDYLK